MSNLLLKEWHVNMSSIVIGIALLIVASVLIADEKIPMFYAILIGCVYLFSTGSTDTTNKSDLLINSLPVKPKEIVASKYVFSLLFGLAAVIVVAVINAFLPFLEGNRVVELAIGISAIGLFTAVYFPLFYLIGPRFVTYGLVAFFILWFAVFPIIFNIGAENNFWGLAEFSPVQLSLSILGLTTVILILSWYISGWLYQNKQL
ncbi:ABC-2 transporter permease [Natribacillus halophilus]|uniref:ABC-2 family transporter protein n=1 Tax=Natribacillus halophilus TaxID=549003 RepID=A0A1G8SKK8_9BACI|nr:ABC-2 transporter permease [Natribacillus halophilus]SDJ29747.1 ABC-2 family transporter protein [Natribacillus halophilus]